MQRGCAVTAHMSAKAGGDGEESEGQPMASEQGLSPG